MALLCVTLPAYLRLHRYYDRYVPQLTKHSSTRNSWGTPHNKASNFKFDLKKLSRQQVRSHVATRLKGSGANKDAEDHVLLGSSVLNVEWRSWNLYHLIAALQELSRNCRTSDKESYNKCKEPASPKTNKDHGPLLWIRLHNALTTLLAPPTNYQ